MVFERCTADDVSERKTEILVPEGFYPVVLTGSEAKQSRATQGMLELIFSPLREENKAKTADGSIDIKALVMSDQWADDDVFRASKAEKLAKDRNCKATDISKEAIDVECQNARVNARFGMLRTASALLGRKKSPPVPIYDKEARVFRGDDGKIYTKEQKEAELDKALAWARNQIADIANGDLDIRGYVCAAEVEHNEFNSNVSHRIRGLYERLPEDKSFVPVSDWDL